MNKVELELCPSDTKPMEVALTRTQRAKARQLLTDPKVTMRKPRHAKTKQDWEKEEAIHNLMFEAIKQIQDQEDKARQALSKSAPDHTITDSDMELAGEWTALSNSDAMEEISLAKKPLPSLLDKPAQAAKCPKVQLAQVVGKQILDSIIIVTGGSKSNFFYASPIQSGPCLSISRLKSSG
jgi:hypothetical protein